MLEIEGLSAGYPGVPVLNNISLMISDNEIVALFGHNGAGKSTLLKAIFGLLLNSKGKSSFNGQDTLGKRPEQLTRLGLAMVPQDKGIFPNLTVGENLKLGLWASGTMKDSDAESERRLERVFYRLPMLRKRWGERAGNLSGGQQQMVSIGRALLCQPALLLLDEPSVGLSPKMVEETMELVHQLQIDEGISVLLVEQNVNQALAVANRVYVLKNGQIIWQGHPELLKDAHSLWNLF